MRLLISEADCQMKTAILFKSPLRKNRKFSSVLAILEQPQAFGKLHTGLIPSGLSVLRDALSINFNDALVDFLE